jgi:hypothetical protein
MWIEWIGQSSMDARTEQAYQQRITELTHQLAEHKEQLRASAKTTPCFLTASRVYSKVSMD